MGLLGEIARLPNGRTDLALESVMYLNNSSLRPSRRRWRRVQPSRLPVAPRGRRDSRPRRSGIAAVEFACVLPLALLLLLGATEIGRAVVVQHSLVEAARAGCRLYTVKELTEQDVEDIVDQCMAQAGISDYSTEFDPPLKASIATHMQPVTITVSVPHDKVAWIPAWFMSGKTIAGTCTMPADLY
jgi:hypothetical protein